MTPCCRLLFCTALISLTAPLWADPLRTPAAAAGLSAQPVLDGLAGKHQVIGLTERSGNRFLGRVISGDHGLYVVQTFHYVSAPATTPVTTLQTATVLGRNRRRPQQETRRVTTQVTTQTTIADDAAVRALLSGVAGASFRPVEEAGPREIIAPSDVLCLQALSPPSPAEAPLPSTTPVAAAPAVPPSSAKWTMKTLWTSPNPGTRH